MGDKYTEESREGKEKLDFWRYFTVACLVFAAVLCCVLVSENRQLRENLGEYQRLAELEDYVERRYYTSTDKEALIDSALKGYVAGLGDPYSSYMTEEEYGGWQQKESGTSIGIGVTVSYHESGLYVEAVDTGGPADKGGVKPGDIITAVDGTAVPEIGYEEAVMRVRGEEGTEVTLTIDRSGNIWDAVVTRSTIVTITAEGCMLEDNIGYIHISAFRENTYEQYSAVLSELLEQGAKGIVFDLRNNTGGLLSSLEDIVDPLLPEGDIAIACYGDGTVKTIVDSDSEELNIPMSVIINGGTASAGELFAASLSDFGKAALVGTTSFGKGIMQDTSPIAGGALTLTVATYQTVRGECYHGIGVEPDVTVELPEGFAVDFTEPDIAEDTQLKAAVKALYE